MAYRFLKSLNLPAEICSEIFSFMQPTAAQLHRERLLIKLQQSFINYDLVHTIPFIRKLGVSFRYGKQQIFAALTHDLGFELDDFTDFL